MKAAILSAVAITLGVATPVNAGWQYTRWGMSPDQVVAASRGAAWKAVSPALGMNTLGRHVAGSYKFDVSFRYASTGLDFVLAKPVDPSQCTSLRDDMLATYGQPVEEKTGFYGVSYRWDDKNNDNAVRFFPSNDGCGLNYQPLGPRSGRGL